MKTNDTNNALVSGDDILQVIPQKPPMAMIDKIIAVDENNATTALTILEDNIFCEDNLLQAPGLTENIAQTAAAHRGYLAQQAGEKTPVGFIGAIKNLKIHYLPEVGTEIITEIQIENQIMNFTLINGHSKLSDGTLLAECQMKIFVHENTDENN